MRGKGKGSAYALCTVAVAMVLVLTGCRTKYVTVEKVERDTVYRSVVQRDSVLVLDSVLVNIYEKGDTVYRETTRWRVQWRERWRCDTLYRESVDSVPVVHVVEKELTKWQRFCLDYGKVMTGGSLAAIVLGGAALMRRARWLKKTDKKDG